MRHPPYAPPALHAPGRALSRTTGVVLVAMCATLLPVSSASAVSGVGVAAVDLERTDHTALIARWDDAVRVVASASRLTVVLPVEAGDLGLDPASSSIVARTPDGALVTAGLSFDRWDVVVDLPALSAAIAAAGGDAVDGFDLLVRSAADHGATLDLTIVVAVVPGSSRAPSSSRLHLGDATSGALYRAHVASPTRVAGGVPVVLRTDMPRIWTGPASTGTVTVHAVDAAGTRHADLTASAVPDPDGSDLRIPTPTWLAPGDHVVATVATSDTVGLVIDIPVVAPAVDPVEGYTTAVYQDLFLREPDPAGLADWGRLLRAGTPYGAVSDGITASAEFRLGLVDEAYRRYLARGADPVGRAGWLDAMGRGLHIQQMEAGFLTSAEFYAEAGDDAAWVRSLYATVLHRRPSADEVGSWVARTREVGPYAVALGFLYSTEHLTGVVDGYYQGLLHRTVDPAGVASWVTAIQHGSREEAIVSSIVSSPEYRANVPRP